jgi:hypothetical protein
MYLYVLVVYMVWDLMIWMREISITRAIGMRNGFARVKAPYKKTGTVKVGNFDLGR